MIYTNFSIMISIIGSIFFVEIDYGRDVWLIIIGIISIYI